MEQQKQPRERVQGIPEEILIEAALATAKNEGLRARVQREIEQGNDPLLPLSFGIGEGSKAAVALAREMRNKPDSSPFITGV